MNGQMGNNNLFNALQQNKPQIYPKQQANSSFPLGNLGGMDI